MASYFLFLRALLGLNVFLFILMLGFVIIPQVLGSNSVSSALINVYLFAKVVIGDGLDVPPSAKNGSKLSLILDGKVIEQRKRGELTTPEFVLSQGLPHGILRSFLRILRQRYACRRRI